MASLLIVDDSPAEIALLREANIEAATGFTIESAGDGAEAVTTLAGRGVDAWPDLVLMDLRMPRLDGQEFLSWRRRDARLSRLPVFIRSSSERDEDIDACDALGADGYVVKPRNWTGNVSLVVGLAQFITTGTPLPGPLSVRAQRFAQRQRESWERWVRLRELSDGSWRAISRSLDALSRRLPS